MARLVVGFTLASPEFQNALSEAYSLSLLSQGTPFPLNLDFTFAVLGVEVAFTVLHYVDDPICQSEVYTEISDLDLCLAHRTLFRAFAEANQINGDLGSSCPAVSTAILDGSSATRKFFPVNLPLPIWRPDGRVGALNSLFSVSTWTVARSYAHTREIKISLLLEKLKKGAFFEVLVIW